MKTRSVVRRVARVAALATLVAASVASLWGCGTCADSSDDDGADKPPVASALEGLQAMPAGVHVVVGADVRVLRGSWLVDRAIAQMFRRDPGLQERFAELVAACSFDPAEDLDSVLIGLTGHTGGAPTAGSSNGTTGSISTAGPSAAPVGSPGGSPGGSPQGSPGGSPKGSIDQAIMVLTGRFVEADLASCVSRSMAADGGSLTSEPRDGRTFYKAGGRTGSHGHVWFSLVGPRTLVVATSPQWLARAAGNGAKVTASETMASLLSRVDQNAGLWAVGEIEERVGAGLVELTGGKVATPPRSMIAEIHPRSGLQVLLGADMASEQDANYMLSLIKEQISVGGWVLVAYGLGPVVRKLGVDSEGKTVYLRLSLDRDELREVLSSIDTTAQPGPNPDNHPDGGPVRDAGPGEPEDKPEE